MGYGPSWGALCLHEDEVILCCAEDQKHCFHIYCPGYAWRGFFVLNRKASGACFQDGLEDKAYPRVVSAPMGWSNVVDFIQDGFENLAMRANLEPGRIIRMNEPSPLAPLTTPRDFYSFYVDNFDQFKVVWRTEAGTYEGSPSAEQLQLRQEMETLGVGRDPKKAAESTRSWSSLGAEVDGDLGLIGSSLKFRRALLGANLKVVGEDTVGSHSLGLQSVVSKNMHSVQYKRALACLFDSLYTEMGLAMPKVLSERSKDELLLLSMTLPLHWMSQKMKLEGQIYATDASEEGGGACQSTGLTKWGHSRVHTLAHETAGIEGGGADPILVVECFAGIGGLKQALDLLGLVPMGNIGIDSSSECGKVFRQHCRHAVWYNSIESITFAEVKEWRKKFSKVTKVLLSGGWPCVNHSHLNPRRGGAEAASSQLLDKMLEIKTMLRLCSRELGMPDWEVLEFYENVVMDKHDYKIQSGKIGFGGTFFEAAMVGQVRRPRIYWMKGFPFVQGTDGHVGPRQPMRNEDYMLPSVNIQTDKPPMSWSLCADATKMEAESEPFPTITRPQARATPPEQPAGLEHCSPKALARWKGDNYRLQPYHYENRNMVVDAHGPRKLKPEEQLRLMGFPTNHLELKSRLSADLKSQLIGNSFAVIAVARLLVGLVATEEQVVTKDLTEVLWRVWKRNETKIQHMDKPWKLRFGSAAADLSGVGSLRLEVCRLAGIPLRQYLDPERRLSDEELLVYLLTRNGTHKGADIRMDLGMPYAVGEMTRQSIDPSSWTWKVLMSYAWKQKDQHINVLETIAVLDLLRKLARSVKFHKSQIVILVDNQVVLSVLTKGRTSAKALQSPIRRVSAVLLASEVLACYGWIKSGWNPADGPSRWRARRSHA
jgi:site-specific DNA-cytosine methylase